MSNEKKQPKIIERMKESPFLKDENVNFIFNNLRNVGLSVIPIIAATAYVKNPSGDPVVLFWLIVVFSAVISLLLLLLNILHAWRKIAELNMSLWLRAVMAIFYCYAISIGFQLLLHAKQ